MTNFNVLKARQRRERKNYPSSLSVRVHRALSWLDKAEQCEDDDSKFVFLWIAFNSAYAQEFDQSVYSSEKCRYQEFLQKLVDLDDKNRLTSIVWTQYSSAIRLILDNEFILQAYWDFQLGKISEEQWKEERSKAKAVANNALSKDNTATVLAVLFSRLYTLRNQVIHGGATYNSSANRDQMRDCTSILEKIIPVVIEIMMDNSQSMWGDPVYPLIEY